MIYTITFNPALDYISQVENFEIGKINRTKTEKILPGGKGLNVSTVLKNLGIESTALGFIAGFTGEELKRSIEEKGLSTGEKKMLHNAKQILVSELVLAEHATQDEVEELVDNKINTSFAMFKTDTNNIEVSTGSIVNKFIPFDDGTNSSNNA